MAAPWTAERVVSPDEALALIAEQHPGLAPSRIRRLGEGWDNTAFLVDDRWVFRFPRRDIAVELLMVETQVLPAIASALPLPIPVPEWIGEPTEAFPWPFAGYRALSGRTACRAALDREQRRELARTLGRFLAALHDVDPAGSGAPRDTLDRTDTRCRIPLVRKSLDACVRAGLLDDTGPWEALLEQAHPALPRRDVLVHADLYVRHVLVDDAGQACGVIDWGDVHRGHPGLDFALAFSLLPPEARDDLRTAYGREIDEESWTLARQRGLLYAAVLADYGSDTGDLGLVREGVQALQWVLE